MPKTAEPDTNIYDMRLVAHRDGWITGCSAPKKKDPMEGPLPMRPVGLVAQCGIARTGDLVQWER